MGCRTNKATASKHHQIYSIILTCKYIRDATLHKLYFLRNRDFFFFFNRSAHQYLRNPSGCHLRFLNRAEQFAVAYFSSIASAKGSSGCPAAATAGTSSGWSRAAQGGTQPSTALQYGVLKHSKIVSYTL